MRGVFVLVAVALVALAPPAAAAPVFDDPAGLIEYAYEPYESGVFPEDVTELFSPTLKQLWEGMVARSADLEMPLLDFDPFVDGQDYEISELVISHPAVDGDSAIVAVSFLNFGEPRELRYTLVRRVEGWKIDDIESLAGEFPWRLSELLADDPLLN